MTEVNLARKWWPQFFQTVKYMSEEEIIEDLVNKIEASYKSSLWWGLVTEEGVRKFNVDNPTLIIKHYKMDLDDNEHFKNHPETLHNIQLRILLMVWKILNDWD